MLPIPSSIIRFPSTSKLLPAAAYEGSWSTLEVVIVARPLPESFTVRKEQGQVTRDPVSASTIHFP